jgi:septal ring factor EnvC (AmiA/AmiB activator)
MLLSKLKLVAAVLLVTALAGAGAAWVTTRVAAGEPPASSDASAVARPASEPPAPRGAPERRAADERPAAERHREELKVQLDRAADRLAATEARLAKLEDQWLDELIDARLRVLDLQEEIRAMERELDEAAKPPDAHTDARLRDLIAERERAAWREAQARAKQATGDEKESALARRAKELEGQVEARQRELEKEAAERKKRREDGLARLRKLRREMLAAEEKVGALRRRQDGGREDLRRDLEDQQRRVRQLQRGLEDPESPAQAAGRPAAELDRKLDEVLRELAELRRSLRPPAGKQPEEP